MMGMILLLGCSFLLLIYVLADIADTVPDRPLDDKTWQIDYDNLYSNLQKYVSNQQEKIHAVLNVQNALKLLKNGTSKEGFAILTDKACYFVGKIYQKKWILLPKSNIHHRIVISELKGVKTSKLSRKNMFILSVVLTICEICWLFYLFYENFDPSPVRGMMLCYLLCIVITFCVAIYCFVKAFIIKRTHICMEFASLTITFPISTLGAQEIKDFYKAVSEVQEHNANSSPIPETPNFINAPNTATPNDKIASLSELSKLYEQGLISEEEFNKLKTEIMSN